MSGAIALSAGLNRFTAGDSQGNFTPLATPRDVYAFTRNSPVLLCNRSLIKGRLGTQMPRVVLDVLELFAFVCPACPSPDFDSAVPKADKTQLERKIKTRKLK